MGTEIERKFLLANDDFRPGIVESIRMTQGYLSSEPGRTVRVRLAGETGYLTIKGRKLGLTRAEFEYEIPVEDARQLLALCPAVIDKTRHLVPHGLHTWEVDEFHADNRGLWVAEIELDDEADTFERPPWVGLEVTEDARYTNSALSLVPYSTWPRD